MSFITKKLEELDALMPDNFTYRGVGKKAVLKWFTTAINEMIMEVEKGLPEVIFEANEDAAGFNKCLSEIKQSLSSLREGNK